MKLEQGCGLKCGFDSWISYMNQTPDSANASTVVVLDCHSELVYQILALLFTVEVGRYHAAAKPLKHRACHTPFHFTAHTQDQQPHDLPRFEPLAPDVNRSSHGRGVDRITHYRLLGFADLPFANRDATALTSTGSTVPWYPDHRMCATCVHPPRVSGC